VITLQRYTLREKLLAAPPPERDLFLALGGVANELILLQKLIIWTQSSQDSEPFLQAKNTQGIVLFRLLGGKLHEAWLLIQKAFFGAKVAREYDGCMDSRAQKALAHLKRYHSSKNVLDEVRNEYAFHFCASHFGDGLKHNFDDPLSIYISLQPINCLFYFSELLANASLIGNDTAGGKFAGLVDESSTIVNHWLIFIGGYQTLFLERHREVLEGKPETLQLDHVKSLDEISIPWFVDAPPTTVKS